MINYIIKRLLTLIPVVIAVAIVIFTIMYFVPGDPAKNILGQDATEEQLQRERELLGLADPYFVQLGKFLYQLFIKLNPGTSWLSGFPVMTELRVRIPRTLLLSFLTMALGVAVGIPLGVTAAVNQNKLPDKLCMIGSMTFISIPDFWLALEAVILFGLRLHWLPTFGMSSWKCWILPVVCGSLPGIASNARQTRSAMLEVIRSDYVATAKAKGLAPGAIKYKHALPNALIPLITMMGGHLARCLGGSMILENIFSMPGMGMYLTTGITQRDYPVVRSVVVILAIVFGVVMVLVDIVYAFVDPRIKAIYENQTFNLAFWRKRKDA